MRGGGRDGRTDVGGLAPEALAAAFRPLGARPFVGRQVFRWLHARAERDFRRMTDLPRDLRATLAERFEASLPIAEERRVAADGTTRWAWRLADGERTESVFIPNGERQATLCLSSQVGCPLACTFCVSGLLGVRRSLSTAEIVGQAEGMLAQADPLDRINVVFMGMGEALLNLDAVEGAFRVLSHPDGRAVALRRMTVSTAGHVPAMERFGALAERPRLAVSLNAASDAVRDRIMPINRVWNLDALLDACRRFPLGRGERLTFEYVLLAGVNDSEAEARRLPRLVARIPSKVNLIPWNPAEGFDFESPSDQAIDRFASILAGRGVTVTVRRRRGADAGAACGQLAIRRPVEPGAPAGT